MRTALKFFGTFLAGVVAATAAMVTVGDRFYPPPVRHGPALQFVTEYLREVVKDPGATERTLTTQGFQSVQQGIDETVSSPKYTYQGFWRSVAFVDHIGAHVADGASNRYRVSFKLHYKAGGSEDVASSYWTLSCAQKRYTVLRWKECPAAEVRLDDVNQTTS